LLVACFLLFVVCCLLFLLFVVCCGSEDDETGEYGELIFA